MFYEFLGSYVDLSTVTAVNDKMDADHYGSYRVGLDFVGCDGPYWISINKYLPWEMEHARQALKQIRQDLAKAPTQDAMLRQTWPYVLGDDEIDLSKVRAIEPVERIASTSYEYRNRGVPKTVVKFQFRVIIAGREPLAPTIDNTPDVKQTPLHTVHEKLMRQWMLAMGWQDAA